MSGVRLRAEDAVELAELLEFLIDWIEDNYERASRALNLFTAWGYDIDELRGDLARFVFLLGGDGERFVFGGAR